MIKDLTELVGGLDQITAAFISQAKADELVGDELEDIDDLDSLAEIEEATENAAIKSSASIRRWILGQQRNAYVGPTLLGHLSSGMMRPVLGQSLISEVSAGLSMQMSI